MTALHDPSKLPNFLLWLDALESGEFEQCGGALRERVITEDDELVTIAYCCLGVAVEVACRNGVEPGDWRDSQFKCVHDHGEPGHNLWCIDFAEEVLPEEVVEWLGLGGEDERDPVLAWSEALRPAPELFTMSELSHKQSTHKPFRSFQTASTLNDNCDLDFRGIAQRLRLVYVEGRAPANWREAVKEKRVNSDDA